MKSYKLQQTPYGFDIQALANYRVVPATRFRCSEEELLSSTLIAPMFRASQADNLESVIRTCLITPQQLSTINNW